MKKIMIAAWIICCSFSFTSLKAQKAYEDGLLEHVGVGINVGLYGPGINANVSLLPFLKARVGLNYFGYKYGINKDFEGDSQSPSTAKVPGRINNANFSLINGSILADFYPFQQVPFSVTVGTYIGQNRVGVDGSADDKFEYGGIKVNPNTDNTFKGDIVMGNVIKPYFGIGFGRTISDSRVGFRFDLGAIYQGSAKFKSNNVEGINFNLDDLDTSAASTSDQTALMISLMKFWPQMSFSLSYRIF